MVERGKDHLGALCVVAASLAERFWAVMNRGRPYLVCDVDNTPIDSRPGPSHHRHQLAGANRSPCPPPQQEGEGPPDNPNRTVEARSTQGQTGRPSPTRMVSDPACRSQPKRLTDQTSIGNQTSQFHRFPDSPDRWAKDNEDIRACRPLDTARARLLAAVWLGGKVVEPPAYWAVALTRSIVVRMRRRGPKESVDPWRLRLNGAQAQPICRQLAYGRHGRPGPFHCRRSRGCRTASRIGTQTSGRRWSPLPIWRVESGQSGPV